MQHRSGPSRGSQRALGNMKKDRVVPLVTTPESHPIWYTEQPLVIPRGEAILYRYCLMEGGSVKAFERTESGGPREIVLDTLDTIIEDDFPANKVEGFGQDAEKELFEQMRQLTRKYSEAEKLVFHGNAKNARLFLVCYHLPVIVRRTVAGSAEPFEVTWNDSILARSQTSSIAESMRTYWVGTLSIALDALTAEEKSFLMARLEQMDVIPIIIDDDIAASAYYGFCKQVMWPVFHNVDQLDQIHAAWNLQDDFRSSARTALPPNALPPSGMRAGGLSASRSRAGSSGGLLGLGQQGQGAGGSGNRSRSNSSVGAGADSSRVLQWNYLEEEFHMAHEAVNLIFARTLLGLAQDNDVIWVHDYHLMGLPRLLRGKDDRKRRRASSADTEKDPRNASSASTAASEKIAAAADAPLTVPPSLANLRIIFFMHIPFPTSQLFRTLPRASDLLESMICADVVGFHAFDHARHFLNATKRMLGIRSGSRPGGLITLQVADREVIVTVSHVSIETDRVGPAALHPETLRIAREIKQRYLGKRIVVGVDVCQRLSGVALKLSAFDKLLSDSSWGRKGNIVLIQKCLRPSTRPGDEETTSADLRKMVGDINAKYSNSNPQYVQYQRGHQGQQGQGQGQSQGTGSSGRSPAGNDGGDSAISSVLAQRGANTDTASSLSSSRGSNLDSLGLSDTPALSSPSGRLLPPSHSQSHSQGPSAVVDYEERDRGNELGLHERLALWLVADVFLLTPIREGLNLMPLEYVYVRRDLPNAGAVVVSEFSTCAALLNGSLKVNPFAPQRVADALEKALMLTSRDKELRRQRDLPFISSHPSYLWTHQIVSDLEQLQQCADVGGQGGKGGSGVAMPTPLQDSVVLSAYEQAARTAGICQAGSRVFLFDYGGTLLHKEKFDIYIKRQTLSAIAGRKPSPDMMAAIERLSNDPLNVVVVITGLTKQKLGDTFAGLKNVTLATSNGLVYSWGQNLLPAPHEKRTQLQTLASAAAAAALQQGRALASPRDSSSSSQGLHEGAPISSAVACEENKRREQELGEVTQDLIALSLADSERDWAYYKGNGSIDWHAVSAIALPIISKFTFRTNGTCQSPRIPGIGWSYFGADPEEGHRQAKQLTLELEAALANFDVQVTSLIQSSLEVVPRTLHKGLLVQPLLEKVMGRRGGRLPSFLLVVGDEESDDRMVEVVYRTLGAAAPSAGIGACRTFTACVGKRPCPAQFYLNDVEDVEGLLTRLALSPTTTPLPAGAPASVSLSAAAMGAGTAVEGATV